MKDMGKSESAYPVGMVTNPEIAQAFLDESINPTDGDEVIAAFATAAQGLYKDTKYALFRETVNDGLRDRTAHPLIPNDVVNLTLRLVQRYCLKHDPLGYPGEEYEDPDIWKNVIVELLADEAERELLYSDIVWREIQSNIYTRSVPIELFMVSEQQRLGRNLRIMEVGGSDGQISKALTINYGISKTIEFVEINTEDRKGRPSVTVLHEATKYIRNLLAKTDKNHIALTTDIFNPNDPVTGEHIFACSFRPKELRVKELRDIFQLLQKVKLRPISQYPSEGSRVYFYQGECAESGMTEFNEESPLQEFDLIIFPTVLYMQPDKAAEMLKLTHRYLAKNGVVIVLDRAEPDPDSPSGIQIFNSWGLGKYRLLVQYPHSGNMRFYEIFRMVSDRATQISAGKDIGKIAVGKILEELARRIS